MLGIGAFARPGGVPCAGFPATHTGTEPDTETETDTEPEPEAEADTELEPEAEADEERGGGPGPNDAFPPAQPRSWPSSSCSRTTASSAITIMSSKLSWRSAAEVSSPVIRWSETVHTASARRENCAARV